MADMKIGPGGPNLPAAPAGPVRTEAVRAAQRAFFEAAMTGAPPSPPSGKPVQTTTRAADLAAGVQDSTQRYPRPGSRIDIKV